jgi:hypothetical protein
MLNGLIAAGLALLDWGEGVAGDDAYLEILHRRLGRVRPSERVIYSANPIFIADVVYED